MFPQRSYISTLETLANRHGCYLNVPFVPRHHPTQSYYPLIRVHTSFKTNSYKLIVLVSITWQVFPLPLWVWQFILLGVTYGNKFCLLDAVGYGVSYEMVPFQHFMLHGIQTREIRRVHGDLLAIHIPTCSEKKAKPKALWRRRRCRPALWQWCTACVHANEGRDISRCTPSVNYGFRQTVWTSGGSYI